MKKMSSNFFSSIEINSGKTEELMMLRQFFQFKLFFVLFDEKKTFQFFLIIISPPVLFRFGSRKFQS